MQAWVVGTRDVGLSCQVCAYSGVRAAPGSGTSRWCLESRGTGVWKRNPAGWSLPFCPSRPGTAPTLDRHHRRVWDEQALSGRRRCLSHPRPALHASGHLKAIVCKCNPGGKLEEEPSLVALRLEANESPWKVKAMGTK